MGKASRRKHLEEQQRTFFQIHGDGRAPEEREQARAMLDALQRKLTDDALREDGFYFSNGKCMDDRRPRTTAGMVTRRFDGHSRSVKAAAMVQLTQANMSSRQVFLFTFGLDRISIWDLHAGSLVAAMGVESSHASFICGAAANAGRCDQESSESCIQFAWATHDRPVLQMFDVNKSCILLANDNGHSECNQSFLAGHQQQISAMAFATHGRLLATCSWDSTCILWSVEPGIQITEGLKLVQIFPVHENAATCCTFTSDDQMLLTCGDCCIKVWDTSSFSQGSGQEAPSRDESLLEHERRKWESSIPQTLSVNRLLELLGFDDTIAALVPNHDWIYSANNGLHSKRILKLQIPSDSEMDGNQNVHSVCDQDISSIFAFANKETQQTVLPIEIVKEPTYNEIDQADNLRSESEMQLSDLHATSVENSGTEVSQSDQMVKPDDKSSMSVLEKWERELQQMESFDFEQLLNPSAALCNHESSSSQLTWKPLCADANGQLIREFSKKTTAGFFSSHTSTITSCAVAKECDLVVTVSLDKSIKYWSLNDGLVIETVREAHEAPITCCSLSSPLSVIDGQPQEMLLSTGGKDNLVKIWRRNSPDPVECVYTLTGHYDAVSFCAFDPSGVFVISSGDDTNVIMWRVRPSHPDQPEAPVLVTADRFAITIEWQAPLANGSKLLRYIIRTVRVPSIVIEDELEDTPQMTVADLEIDAKFTTAKVEHLRPGVQYTIQAAAVNAIGVSDFSIPSESIETLAFVPSQIEKPVRFSDRQATQIHLMWTQPSANGARILAYTLRCLPENSVFVPILELSIPLDDLERINPNETRSPKYLKRAPVKNSLRKHRAIKKDNKTPLGPTEYSYTLHGLWPGEVYQFVVAAENRCGLGQFSRPSDYVKMNSTAPDAPERPIVTEIAKRHIDIEWIKPKCNGCEILQYTLQWTQTFDTYDNPIFDDSNNSATTNGLNVLTQNSIVFLTRSITGTWYTIPGLVPGKSVSVRVSASNLIDNNVCDSDFSPSSEKVLTLCDVPDAPEQPKILETTSHTITIGFKAPADNGMAILRYDVGLFSEEMQLGIASKRVEREFSLFPSELDENSNAVNSDGQQRIDSQSKGYPSTFTIHKLRGNTFYSVVLSAVNALGSGRASVNSRALNTAPAEVPAVIMAAPVIEGHVEPTKVNIKWELPAHDGGSHIAAFHLQYTSRVLCKRGTDASTTDEEHEMVIYSGGCELLATFLRPQTLYYFRIATSNSAGKSAFSASSLPCITPSLVTYTIDTYFAHRPAIEHDKARVIQHRYRSWRRAVIERAKFNTGLLIAIRGWHIF